MPLTVPLRKGFMESSPESHNTNSGRQRLFEWLASMCPEKWFAAYGHALLSHPHGYAQIATKARATG